MSWKRNNMDVAIIREQVREILKKFPITRENDIALCIAGWIKQGLWKRNPDGTVVMTRQQVRNLVKYGYKPDTLRRRRQEIQEEGHKNFEAGLLPLPSVVAERAAKARGEHLDEKSKLLIDVVS